MVWRDSRDAVSLTAHRPFPVQAAIAANAPCGSRRVGLLASVTNVREARIALAGGADIIDCKDPATGALGALPAATVRAIVAAVAGRRPVSATVGDLPMEPDRLEGVVRSMAGNGVDLVKVGLLPSPSWDACMEALARATGAGVRLVAVLFADRVPDLARVADLAQAGFSGAMLDTAGKSAGSLRMHLDARNLASFVERTRSGKLICGFAGSLNLGDIAPLVAIGPDYLGFRGALCAGQQRGAGLEAAAVTAARRALTSACGFPDPAPPLAGAPVAP